MSTYTSTSMAPEVQKGVHLTIRSSVYSVLEFVGEGDFGKVALCSNLATNEKVAVKILKNSNYNNKAKKEASTLAEISVLNPDHANIVKFLEMFEYRGQTCLALEWLDKSLEDALKEQSWNPLHLNDIRPIAKQLFVALEALKGLGILHTDLKPDNIMHVNRQDQPLRVKVIDFGEAMPALNALPGMDLQPLGYRAPEIVLGIPFTEAIDVWGVGCILSFLYLADDIFPVDSEYQMMNAMLDVLGQPSEHLLRAGKYTQKFFTVEETADGPKWKRKESPYEAAGWCLDDLVDYYPTEGAAEAEDTKAFVDLLKRLLHLDGDLRISLHEALQHPFITMSHLTDHPDSRDYLTTARTKMTVCSTEDSVDRPDTFGALEHYQELLGSPSGGDLDTSSDDEDQAGRNSQTCGEDLPVESSDEAVSCPSAGELPECSSGDDPAARSSNRTDQPEQTDSASASSSWPKHVMEEMHRFFQRIVASTCCCLSLTEED